MKLSNLHIYKSYGINSTGYEGTITFVGSVGEVSLKLDDDLTDKLMVVVGDALIKASHGVAIALKESIEEERTDKLLLNIEESNNE